MRGRGLKPHDPGYPVDTAWVALHAGAWIETDSVKKRSDYYKVALHAGAWIET